MFGMARGRRVRLAREPGKGREPWNVAGLILLCLRVERAFAGR